MSTQGAGVIWKKHTVSLGVMALAAALHATAFAGGALAAGQEGGAQLPLAPHHAVYDLSLDGSQTARSISGVSGRIAYDITGDACTGYSLDFRQVTILERSEGEAQQIDIRSTTHEEADGSSFRFRQDTSRGGSGELVEGVARHTGAGNDIGLSVSLTKPEQRAFNETGAIAFPSSLLKKIIAAARAGENTASIRLYDAGEDGAKVFDTFAVIGKKAPAAPGRPIEDAARKAGLDKIDRWPVSISYFTPGSGERTPIYAMSFDLYENGIGGSMKMNYGDFAIRGELRSLEQRGTGACANGKK